MEDSTLIELTADIVASQVANNSVPIGDVANLIQGVHGAPSQLSPPTPEPQQRTPLVSIRASIQPDYLICLECGEKKKMLRRHLRTAHGLSPDRYRSDYGLPVTYPITSPIYLKLRREMLRSMRLRKRAAPGTGEAEVQDRRVHEKVSSQDQPPKG